MNDPVTKAAAELQSVISRLQRRLRAEVPNGGLTLSEAAVLGRLESSPETNSRLAALEHVRPQSMTVTVSALERKSLVTRKDDLQDRRMILISLTSEGRDAIRSMRQSRQDWLATAMTELLNGDDQELLVRAIRLMELMADSDSTTLRADT